MQHGAKLLEGIYLATKEGIVDWQESSSSGAYYAKIGDNRVEIIYPITDPSSVMMEQASKSITSFNNRGPNKSVAITQFRLIAYDIDGKVALEIGESSISEESLTKLDVNNMFKYIFNRAIEMNDVKANSTVDSILLNLRKRKKPF